jgi:ClpP class serine protease
MSLKTNEEKDIFEVLVDELHKELKQAVMRNDNVMSNAKRKETMRYLIKAVKANQTEAINNTVNI